MRLAPNILILTFLLAGCGEPSQPPVPKAQLLAPQREALDKSKQVQQTVNNQVEQQQQAVDEETR